MLVLNGVIPLLLVDLKTFCGEWLAFLDFHVLLFIVVSHRGKILLVTHDV